MAAWAGLSRSPATRRRSMRSTTSRSLAASRRVLATSTDRPCGDSSCSTASITPAKNGSAIDSTTKPIAVSVPARSDRAIASGWKLRSLMASRTRCRVSGATRGSSFSTRDAVRRLTPAAFATSSSLGIPASLASLGHPRCAIDGTVSLCRIVPSMAKPGGR